MEIEERVASDSLNGEALRPDKSKTSFFRRVPPKLTATQLLWVGLGMMIVGEIATWLFQEQFARNQWMLGVWVYEVVSWVGFFPARIVSLVGLIFLGGSFIVKALQTPTTHSDVIVK